MLAATADGRSTIRGLPRSLDVRRTAVAMTALSRVPQPGLQTWLDQTGSGEEGGASDEITVEGEGRLGLRETSSPVDCGNSGTTMRLLAGLVSPCPFETSLVGDESLSRRPMERIAEPLRAMGAQVRTLEGHAPVTVIGGPLRGIRYEPTVPSAQVKTAVLLAGLYADGETSVVEAVPTRDHTERILRSLRAPVSIEDGTVTVTSFQHGPFSGSIPGDPSAAAYLCAAALLCGSELGIERVGLNPSRTRFLDVLRRMGADVETRTTDGSLGEPVGDLRVSRTTELRGVTVGEGELPFVIDEVPALALLASSASGPTRFEGAAELRVKETDRLAGLAEGIRDLGGRARVERDTLVVEGGGIEGGHTDARGDHRLAMAFAVGALAARRPSEIAGMEWAKVSFPGFIRTLERLGAAVEVGE
jgi:3-phosphoshikimate 1-carboxyvinyltransferase